MSEEKTNKDIIEEVAEVIKGDPVEQTPEQIQLEKNTKVVSEKIASILQEDGFYIQPIIEYKQFGITPNVVLVKKPVEVEVEPTPVEATPLEDNKEN